MANPLIERRSNTTETNKGRPGEPDSRSTAAIKPRKQQNGSCAGAARAEPFGNGAGAADRRCVRREASTLHFFTLVNFDHFAEINRAKQTVSAGSRRAPWMIRWLRRHVSFWNERQ
jgi:hypothetical protein